MRSRSHKALQKLFGADEVELQRLLDHPGTSGSVSGNIGKLQLIAA